MGAVSNATELSNAAIPGKILAPIVSPAFVKSTVMLNLMMASDLPGQGKGNVVGFVRKGYLTAAVVAEATAAAFGSGGELTDTVVDATAAKAVVVSGPSLENQRFGTQPLSRFIEDQASAIARYIDDDALSLASGLSVSVTASSIATIDDLFECQFSILNSNCPNQEVLPAWVPNARGYITVKKEIHQTGATAYQSAFQMSLAGGMPKPNGYCGEIPGVCTVWRTSGHATSGGDTVTPFIHPMWCLGIAADALPGVLVGQKISEGFYTEVGSYLFYDVLEVNDLAGVKYLFDT